jgi:DNA-binding MarR family transcriptional regulator
MSKNNKSLELFINLAKIQAIMNRRFDNSLGGLGFNEFIILFHLNQAPEKKLSRIVLSEKLGLTASGITRILLPMEKIGLVGKETHASDARISLVLLAPGGKQKLTEALERAGFLVEDLLGQIKPQKIAELDDFLAILGKNLK